MEEQHIHQEPSKKEDSVQISKSTLWQIISGVLGLLLVISIFTSGFGFGKNGNTGPTGGTVVNNNQPSQGNNVPTGIVDVSADDDPFLGSKDAKVTVIEFSDFQCPFCGRFYVQTLPSIVKNYIETGKVKLIFRDFPLVQIHQNAQKAAEAATCADRQGKFWEMHNKLFENQNDLGLDNLKKFASDLGLDTGKFNSCLDSGETAAEVQKDEQEGLAIGIQGTPGFIIGKTNGNSARVISGAYPYNSFQEVIDSQL